MTEIIRNDKKGISSFIIRLFALIVMTCGIVLTYRYNLRMEWVKHISWIPYPIFAFLLAVGFDETSNRIKYFLRLLLFALLSEIPYDYLCSGKLINWRIQNGMLTLCVGYLVLCIIRFVHKKLNNIIITCAVIYFAGFGAYWLCKRFNFEFYAFGIMFIEFFYVSRHVKYQKLLQLLLVSFLTFYVSTETYLTFIIGNIQYSIPYKAFSFISLLIIWLYNEKRGPNKLWLKIAFYLYYPLMLVALGLINTFIA